MMTTKIIIIIIFFSFIPILFKKKKKFMPLLNNYFKIEHHYFQRKRMRHIKYFIKLDSLDIVSIFIEEALSDFYFTNSINGIYEISKEFYDSILQNSFISYKDFMIFKIDEYAGKIRSKYITTTPGQGETYLLKLLEAEKLKLNSFSFVDIQQEYPLIHNEMIVYGKSIEETVDNIIQIKTSWSYLTSSIEKIRLSSKLQILNASSKEECDVIFSSAIYDFNAY